MVERLSGAPASLVLTGSAAQLALVSADNQPVELVAMQPRPLSLSWWQPIALAQAAVVFTACAWLTGWAAHNSFQAHDRPELGFTGRVAAATPFHRCDTLSEVGSRLERSPRVDTLAGLEEIAFLYQHASRTTSWLWLEHGELERAVSAGEREGTPTGLGTARWSTMLAISIRPAPHWKRRRGRFARRSS